jgi:hypothetical protein
LNAPTGCSNRMASKAATSEDPRRTLLCTLRVRGMRERRWPLVSTS